MSAPTAEQIVKAMEGVHSRLSEMGKNKDRESDNAPMPMSQETINAFFAPRKGSESEEGLDKPGSSKAGYPPSSNCASTQAEVPHGQMDPEAVMRLAMELAKSVEVRRMRRIVLVP